MKIKNLFLTLWVGLAFVIGPLLTSAVAGPVLEFGPNDEGLLKLDYQGQFRFTLRDTGSEPDGEGNTSEFNFRRNRIALIGSYGDVLGIYVQTEFMEDNNIGTLDVDDGDNSDFYLTDAQLRFNFSDNFKMRLGKFKYNFIRENLEACEIPLTLDRSLFIRAPFVSTRDKGVALWGNLFNDRFQYRLDAMNGRNDSISSPKSELRYSARAHLSLLDPEKGYGYRGTYIGKKKVLTIGAAYQYEADVAFKNTVAQTGSADYQGWTADLFFEYPVEGIGTFTFSTAYVDYDLDEVYKGANPDVDALGMNGEKNGGYTKVAYMLPNLPLQLFARAENWSFARMGTTRPVIDQELDWYAGGINYFFRGQDLKLSLEYSKTDFDTENAEFEDFNTFVAQLQVLF